MILIRRLLGGLRSLLAKTRTERELDEELRTYLETAVDEKVAAGMTREEAVRAARVEIGSLEAVKDRTRDVGWETLVESVWQDVCYAFRSFRRTPAFTAAAVATLALGIGGTTAIFSIVDGLFLRAPDGVADPSSLRKVFIRRDSGNATTPNGGPGSWDDYLTMRDGVPAFGGVAAYLPPSPAAWGRGTEAAQVRAGVISHDFLQVLGVRPALGRFFVAEEDGAPGAYPVAVISHGMWQARFGGAPEVIGTPIRVNGEQLDIVGVAPRGFHGIGADVVDVWLPSSVGPSGARDGSDWRDTTLLGVFYLARLAPGATDVAAIDQAAAALGHAAEASPSLDQTPEIMMTSLALAALPYGTRVGTLSLWLALVAGLVLLVACANVANLLLARALARRRELAVRLSLGAGGWRVARQHLTESTLLALWGGAAGVLLAYVGMGLMRQFPLPPSAGRIDGRLLGFALAASLLSGVLFGLLPALRAVRIDPVHGLRNSRTGDGPRGSASTARARRALVVLQVTLSIALLVGAGLFVRSLRQVNAIDTGVALDRLLVASVDLKAAGYGPADREQFYEVAVSRLLMLPGVEGTAIVHAQPFGSWYPGTTFWRAPGRTGPDGQDVQGASLNLVGPGYFSTAGTRLLRGREIAATDRSGERVAVVNEALARKMADDGDVVGPCVPFGPQLRAGGCTRILGVVETQRRWYLQDEEEPMVFVAWAQAPDAIAFGVPALLIRTRAEPAAHAAAVRSALQGLRPDLPYVSVYPLADNVAADVLPFRLGATLFSLFGALAVVLAGLWLYGMLGYFVNERTQQIGIRRSLGAPAHGIVALVMRQGLVAVSAGLVIGLGVAFGGTRYLESLLFGIEPHDPMSFATAAAFLVCVAIVAMLLPAWRAARVDPMIALRSE